MLDRQVPFYQLLLELEFLFQEILSRFETVNSPKTKLNA